MGGFVNVDLSSSAEDASCNCVHEFRHDDGLYDGHNAMRGTTVASSSWVSSLLVGAFAV